MTTISVEDWQLLSFFEVEPDLLEPNDPWCYNDAVYRIVRGDLAMSFAIAPAYHDIRIILQHHERTLYELNALRVHDVRYRNEDRVEMLDVILNDRETIVLRVKPHIELQHRISDRM